GWIGASVRALETFAGTYTVRMRVRPAGQYVDGRIVLGWTRRDRGVEVTFEAGNREVAEKTGESVKGDPGAWIGLSDLRSVVGRRVVGLPPSPHVRALLWSTGLAESDPTGGGTLGEALDASVQPFLKRTVPLDVHVAVLGERGGGAARTLPAGFPTCETLAI